MSNVIAILCSDIHLCHTPPVARSAEPDWYVAMERQLDELRAVAEQHGAPIVCAGDIFDRWNSPPELINFAIQSSPKMHSIPGQHDLPHHRYEDMQRSAYWTLVAAGVLTDLGTVPKVVSNWLAVHPFPWGFPIKRT